MKYLHVFNSETDYNTVRESNYKEPWVSATNMGVGDSTPSYRVNYNKSEYEKLLETPLTFEITSAGRIVWKANSSAYTVTLEYSKDSGQNWTQITSNTGSSAPSISVEAGDMIQFRCGNDNGYDTMSSGGSYYNSFTGTTAGFKVKGNIMSLLSKNNFASIDTLQSVYTFCYLFQKCTGLTDASKLVLPATTLAEDCYYFMFNGCTSLTTAPELPATTLAAYCYSNMFNGCTGLTTAPELPATTLANYCYYNMFQNCTNLTTAPSILPATTLVRGCCAYMFYNCRNLTTAPELPATTLAQQCYNNMFERCTSLTTAPELLATTLAQDCYQSMFSNCTSLITAPELPATTLAQGCYSSMFYNCVSLNYIKAMFTTTPSDSYTYDWVKGVASTGTFVKNSAATWDVSGSNGVPTGWTVQTV